MALTQSREVVRCDARPCQDLDASGRTVYQRSDQRCTGCGAGGLAAGEDGVKSQLAGCFQGSKGVPADIKSPVQGQRHRPSGLLSGLFAA